MAEIKNQPVALGNRPLVKRIRGQQLEQRVGARARFIQVAKQRRMELRRRCERLPCVTSGRGPFVLLMDRRARDFLYLRLDAQELQKASMYSGVRKNCYDLAKALPRWLS